MQQLEIGYFYPLTEQIPLGLDYTECVKPKMWTTATVNSGLSLALSNCVGTVGMSNNLGNPSFTINVDLAPITIVSKKKPNFVKKFIYKSLGMKWKSE
jgi:hypothetical protein